MSAGAAWYVKDREAFVRDPVQLVVGELASSAAAEGLHVEQDQHEEWRSSVGVLQRELQQRTSEIELLKSTRSNRISIINLIELLKLVDSQKRICINLKTVMRVLSSLFMTNKIN